MFWQQTLSYYRILEINNVLPRWMASTLIKWLAKTDLLAFSRPALSSGHWQMAIVVTRESLPVPFIVQTYCKIYQQKYCIDNVTLLSTLKVQRYLLMWQKKYYHCNFVVNVFFDCFPYAWPYFWSIFSIHKWYFFTFCNYNF